MSSHNTDKGTESSLLRPLPAWDCPTLRALDINGWLLNINDTISSYLISYDPSHLIPVSTHGFLVTKTRSAFSYLSPTNAVLVSFGNCVFTYLSTESSVFFL